MSHGLFVERGGEGKPLLVLLHGLGATGAVWGPMLDNPAPSREKWVTLDLAGHGGSSRLPAYSVADHGRAVAETLEAEAFGASVILLGHSLGGVVAIWLASQNLGFTIEKVFGLGIKVDWSEEEKSRMRMLAGRPAKAFASVEDARAAAQRLAGLQAFDDPALLERAVRRDGDKWVLAFDQAGFDVGSFDFGGLRDAARCPVHSACGEHDGMVTAVRLRGFDPEAVEIKGASHNAMVDRPQQVWDWTAAR